MAAEYHLLPQRFISLIPSPFMTLLDENERWEELYAHPEWHFPSPHFPFQQLYDDFLSLLQRNFSRHVVYRAHVGCYAENLSVVENTPRVSELLH